jgi:trigger factor
MNILREDKGQEGSVLKVEISKADILPTIEKELKTLQKQAVLKGFRPGKVPMGHIKKLYLPQILPEQVYKLINKSVSEYLDKSSLELLAPMAMDFKDNSFIKNFDNLDSFTVEVEAAAVERIDIDIDSTFVVDYYKVKPSAEEVETEIENIKKNNGAHIEVETVGAEDFVRGSIAQLDADGNVLEGGHTSDKAMLLVASLQDEAKASFIGKKLEECIDLTPRAALVNEAEIASFLGIDKGNAPLMDAAYRYTISAIKRHQAGELSKELLDGATGKENASLEDFKEWLSERMAANYTSVANSKLIEGMDKILADKYNPVLPAAAIERLTDKVEGRDAAQDAKWRLISVSLYKKYGIRVSNDEMKTAATAYIRASLAQMGMNHIPDTEISGMLSNYLSNEENQNRIFSTVMTEKLAMLIKEKATIVEKVLSVSEFSAMLER